MNHRVFTVALLPLILATAAVAQDTPVAWNEIASGLTVSEFGTEQKQQLKAHFTEQLNANTEPGQRQQSATATFGGVDGIMILEVTEGMPAYEAGLRPYQIIRSINGEPTRDAESVQQEFAKITAGQPAVFEVFVPSLNRRNVRFEKTEISVTFKSKADVLLTLFEVKRDDVRRTTFYTAKLAESSPFGMYISAPDDGEPVVFCRYQNDSDRFLGLDSVTIRTDNRTYEVENTIEEQLRNTIIDSGVREWFDRRVTDADKAMLADMQTSSVIIVRLNGSAVYRDYDEQVDRFKQIIETTNLLTRYLESRK